MSALSAEPTHLPSALLALRRAAWPLRCALIRSPRFKAVLDEQAAIDSELGVVVSALLESLYRVVPAVRDKDSRGRLLKLKRALFNRRQLPQRWREAVVGIESEPTLLEAVGRYEKLLNRHRELPDLHSDLVLQELRQAATELASAADFRLAVGASSPTLSAILDRHAVLAPRDLRSVYAYVCRFASKANPLHLFAHLIPGPRWTECPTDRGATRGCEVVFWTSSLLAIEQRLLNASVDTAHVRLALRPMLRTGAGWRVWLKRNDAWCIVSLPDHPLLSRIHDLYEDRLRQASTPTFARRELEAALADTPGPQCSTAVRAAIDTLVARGVLTPYLIEDLSAPAANLRGLDDKIDRLLDCVERWHLRVVDAADISRLETELAAARTKPIDRHELNYFVNSYSDDDLNEACFAAHDLVDALRELKLVVTVEGNFAGEARSICAFYRKQLSDGATRSYLELLSSFLREHRTDRAGDHAKGTSAFETFARRCSAYQGEMDSAQLRSLVSGSDVPADEVCFVGPFDFAKRRFFLTNLFAGDRRFVSRYLLASRHSPHAARGSDGVLDVEVAVPPVPNVNFVARRFDTGFGFDRRWSHGYRRWIDPAQILVRLENGAPVFIDSWTDRRIQFHYRGFLLANLLPVEYRLLLIEHADNYRNPFEHESPPLPNVDFEHRPGLMFGPVCLRRETWCISLRSLSPLLRSSHLLRYCLELRHWIRQRIAEESLWFYRFSSGPWHHRKARLLDLDNPLSAMAFRRACAVVSGHVFLSRMEPGTSGLWRVSDEGYVAELMVEV